MRLQLIIMKMLFVVPKVGITSNVSLYEKPHVLSEITTAII